MSALPSGHPGLHRARKSYECRAQPCLCGGTIGRGEVHVSAHDYSPERGPGGRPLTHLPPHHFSAHYHVVCFARSTTTDRLTWVVSYGVEDLENFDKYGDEARRLLAEFQKNQTKAGA